MSEGIDPDTGELSADALGHLRTMRVVSLALISGVVMFAGILLVVLQGKFSDQLGLMTIMGFVSMPVCVIASWVVPPLLAPIFPVESPAQTWFLQTLLSMVLLEGSALSGLVNVMINHCQYSLAVAGIPTVMMVLRFPTASRLRAWLQLRQQSSHAG